VWATEDFEAMGKVSASKSTLVEGLALAGPVTRFFNRVGKSGDFVLAKFQSQSESAATTGTLRIDCVSAGQAASDLPEFAERARRLASQGGHCPTFTPYFFDRLRPHIGYATHRLHSK
jgi:hypothetical protein